MNKNRYKLIFSQIKGCLVPVSEYVNSAMSNGSTDNRPRLQVEEKPNLSTQYALSSLSLLVKSTFNPITSAMHLSLGGMSILCLSLISISPLAIANAERENAVEERQPQLLDINNNDEHIKLANANNTNAHNTKLHKTENNVIVIDIATPTTEKQISDNRFEKLNIPKGAVFNNSKKQDRSQLVGYLPANPNLTAEEAKVILNQVTGANQSQIEGALEVLGKRADIVIANQNGITLNGVKTINASRFVATTSETIDPQTMMLNVSKGNVVIGVDGFATDDLPYLDIIAKKIEQKHVVRNQNADKQAETEITFVAGTSKYDLNNHQVVEQKKETSSEIAITGSATGAMHGKNIKLIVTDKGAGVKHDGMILSESDIEIALQNGDADLGNTAYFDHEKKIKAKQNVKVTNAKRTVIGNDVEAKQISINAQDLKIRANTELNAHNKATLESQNTISFEEQSKLLSPEITAKATALLDNKGRIYGKTVKLEAESLVNEKEIIAEKELTIDTQGKEISFAKDEHNVATLRKTSPKITAGFVNKGIIESKGDVTLNFKETASFTDKNTKFVKAGKHLKINAKNVELRDQDIQSGANITIDAKESVVQQGGVLASGQTLSITAQNGSIYNLGGILGAGKALQLTAKSNHEMGDIVNQENGLFHTLGTMNLNADNTLYNIGSIYAKNNLSVTANQLLNDVRLSGKISYNGIGVSPRYDISRNAQHGWHVNVYQLNVTLQEQHKADIKVAKMGEIRSDSDFDFQGKKKNNAKTQLINHGLINVKGTLNVNADEVINQMKGFEQEAAVILHKQANIVLRYQPRARYIWTPLAGNAERRFSSLNAFFDALFGSSTILKSSFYSAENFSAYELLRQVKNSPLFSQAMNRVFGAEWHSLSYEDMKSKWKNFKEQPANFIYYPQEKAKILAGSFTGSIKNLQNGEHTEYGSFNGNINIGKHQLSLPSVEFKPEFSDVESLKDEAIELEDILALLDTPNLFIDNSVQFEKEHKNLDKEDLNKDSERPTPPAATENQGGNTSGNTNNEEGEEEDTRDPDETQPEDYVRTDKNVDYLNPDEYFENGYLLNELLQELGEQSIPLEKPLDRASNLVTLSNWERSNGKEQGEMSKKLKKRFREKQKQYKEELKSKAEALALAKAQQQENRLVESKKEAQRQMEDKVAKQQEIRREEEQAAAVREKEKQLEIQIQAEERKQQEAKRIAQEKQQQDEKRKSEEKVAQAQSELEQQQVYEEDVKQEESIAKNSFFKALDATRPKVETDPLYRTKLNYINQDEYVGANYFFNNVSEQNPNQKVKVLGDNYFDHQLITRAIEKKADNHLQQKYNLTDVDLVKKLMDNSTVQAKNLHLQWGERLTKEQQAKLTEDIVWYVKTRVNNQDVFVPQVYFATETLAQNPKAQGTGLISANEINVKTENVTNTGTLSANKLDVEASNKIRNQGSIVSTEETRLVGKKGIENLSRSFANNELGVTVQRAEIKTAGKLHLETDKDSSINVQASDIQAKSAQIRTKELNLKNTHNTKHSYKESFTPAGLALYELDVAGLKVPFVGLSSASSSSEQSSEAISVGSKLAVGDLHLEVEKDINQIGSELTAKQISGVVKGNYNTQAGQNLKNVQKEEYSTQIFASAHASGGGTSVRVDYNSKDGGKTSVGVPTNQTGVGAEAGISFEHSKENESLLTHTNSELQVESGKLTVLGSADIGGVDINTKTSSDKGFELSANDIKSTKQKDQYSKESERTSFKIGPEVEAHSAIADLVSHLAKEYRDAQNGIKQDETVVLQHASDMLNIITGDLAGSSAKLAVERNRETQSTIERSDILTQIGGNVTLSATNGSLALKNVRSDEKTNLTLKAKEDVNILAGEKTKESVETVSRQKLAHGVHAGCGLMSGTCTAGVSTSFEGNESYTHERTTTHSNSLLQGSNIKIEAGGDLNLESSNIDADKVDLNVKGTTNVVSKQDIRNKTTQGFDYNVSAGVALSSATIATPTGTIGGGYTNETETARTVNQQAGIKAKTLTGQVQDLNLQGGYVVSTDESNQLKVKGNITSQALSDQHDKDGGSFGLSVGISERGTSSFNIRGGRSDQKHYQATQKSTLSGVDISQAEIAGSVNTDLSKAKNVTRDDTYASTQFGFEVGDLVELGQKAKNKLRPSSEVDMPSTSSFRSRSQSGEVDSADSASVRNPIYESVETLGTPRRNTSEVELVENPIYNSTPRNRQPTDALPELPNATQPKTKASAEGIYAEISNGDYSTVGDRNADTNRSRTRRATDALPELPNVAQPKVTNDGVDSVSVKNPIYESTETLATPRRNTSDVELVDNLLYGTTSHSRQPTDALPELPNATLPKPNANADGVYAEISNGDYSTVGDRNADTNRSRTRRATDALPELPGSVQPKANASAEGVYAEISNGDYSTVGDRNADTNRNRARRATDALPELPNSVQPKPNANTDGVYAEISNGDYSTVGDRNADTNRNRARRATDALPELPNVAQPKVTNDGVDSVSVKNPIYESTETLTTPRRNASGVELVDNPLYGTTSHSRQPTDALPELPNATLPKPNANADGVYAEISNGDYSTVGDRNADTNRSRTRRATDALPELPNSVQPKANASAEGVYAEISNGDYSTVGDRNADTNRNRARRATDALPELPNVAQPKVTNDGVDSVSVKNPIYESTETLATPRRNASGVELVDNPLYGTTSQSRQPTDALPELPNATQPKTKASAEGIYAEISNGDYSTVGDRNADTNRSRTRRATDALPELPNSVHPKANASAEGVYAEISNGDYSTVGDRNADTNRNRARRATDALPELPNVAQPKVTNDGVDSVSVKNPIYESTETLTTPRRNASGVELVDNPLYGTTSQSKTNDIYSTITETTGAKPRSRRATDKLPEVPVATQPKVNTVDSAERIYEEIPASTNNKANRTLPEIPDSQAKVLANRNNNNGNDSKEGASKSTDDTYSTIAEATNSTPDVRRETQILLTSDNAAKAQSEAKGTDFEALGARPKVRKPNATESLAKPSSSEPDYDTIPATSGTQTSPAPVAKVEPAASHTTSEKPTEKQPESTAVAKSEKTQKSLLARFKAFFTGEKEKSAKSKSVKAEQEAQVPAKPNYDGLEDNLNLKNLLALEDKRSDAFEQNVLKNDKFLDEAREAAKKSIPESTIKQMGNDPTFDEILTEGAKKVEKRINDAITFKPTVEEFSQIQDLVKQLPKGSALEDIHEKTLSITEALAATSKTIQGNPKLKDEVQGAISDFLKSSQNKPLTVEMIETLNRGLRPDEPEDRLLYKKETLTKENAVFSSPEASKIQLKETVDFINQAKQQNVEPSVLAGLVYQRLIAYHPFAEGNGRMARVIVNKLLLDAGYPAFTKFSSDFETQIIPQTKKTAKSATSAEVVKEFLTELGQKPLPEVSQKVNAEKQEPIYAVVDKSPEALAKAKAKGDEATKNQPLKPVVVEEVAPALPKRLSDTELDRTETNETEKATPKAISATLATLVPETFVATVTTLTPKASLNTAETLAPKTPIANATENTEVEKTATAEKAIATQPAVAQGETQANRKAKPVSEKVAQLTLVEQPRTLRQQIQDKFQPLKVKAKIDAVRASVEEYGGKVSFKYAQSKGEVYNEIIKHVETQHGVCESTCAHWIANKVSAQEDFWNTLYEGGKKGNLKKEAIDSIKKLQTEFMNSGSATQQFKLTDSWLQEQGVVPKQKTVGEASRRDEVAGTVSKTDISALTKAILDTGKEKSGVKKISINLEGGSHTVSAAVQGDKVVFFDPNFGEITFPTHEKFESWLKNAFWEKSGYAGKKEGKRFFNVVNYELPEKTNQSKPTEKTE